LIKIADFAATDTSRGLDSRANKKRRKKSTLKKDFTASPGLRAHFKKKYE